jgi:RNase P subunit RPR2
MRPIRKGKTPFAAQKYSEYQVELTKKIGFYCSYCEMPLTHNVEIEHKIPKKQFPKYENDWRNLLLSCKNCNTSKSKTIVYRMYAWSDLFNPFYFLDYSNGILKQKYPNNKTNEIIKLFKLDIQPKNATKDQRWSRRQEAYNTAMIAMQCLAQNHSQLMVDCVINNAKATGF